MFTSELNDITRFGAMSPPWTCKFQFQRGQTSEMTGALFRHKGPLCYIALRNEVAVLDVKGIRL